MKLKNMLIVLTLICCLQPLASSAQNPIIVGNARFTIIRPELIRMEYATDGKFIDDSTLFAVNRNDFTTDFKLSIKGRLYTITTSRMQVSFINDALPFSQMNIKIKVKRKAGDYDWRIYSKDDKNLGGTLPTLDDVAGPVPTSDGLLSQNGWHIIDDSDTKLLHNGWIEERPVNHLKDLYFFAYDTDYKSALKALTVISGVIPMNRKYVHGSWYCRWWNYTDDDYRKIVQEYREHDFPLDIMVMDMAWHTQKEATTGMGHAGNYGWTGYTWNTKLIRDPAKLLSDFKKDNIYVALNDHPHDGIRYHELIYPGFMKSMNIDTTGKRELLFNAGSQQYMNNFFKYALEPNEKMGVDFWWLDWQQDYVLPHVLGFPGLLHLPWLNNLYFKHSMQNNQRGLLFSRWGGWGSQSTPIQFSGDAVSTWDMLKFEVAFTATSSNAGCFFWAHDIGGFYGDRNAEKYVRWTQFGITTSSLRVHSVDDPTLDRRPWLWGKQAEDAMRISYHLRSQLMPYIYSSVWQSHDQSVPLCRAMYIDYSNDSSAYHNPQQYLFGDLLLTAPITTPGKGNDLEASQKVWFPAGDAWYNIFNNKKYNGGTTQDITCDINSFPLFVKGGYPLPMQTYHQRMASAKLDTLVIRCYPGTENTTNAYTLYEDDGLTNDYLKGKQDFTRLTYTQKNDGAIIIINPVTGMPFNKQVANRAYIIELPRSEIKTVTENNKKLDIKTYNNIGIPYVMVPAADIHKKIIINCTYKRLK
ncbi:TIM-barrel domain-containing protein [Mucilaginibacter sp. X5P1]|uniref:glycoside hydrolase family 31 protein n=1 Tax=Mucilaginibacter sp. X5P1 TaxID=2723088 RepID=UPI0018442FA0|nr:glycoside hydrolase family 31 protein [Mucilaginibacter sp. X5P1]MBB6136619.1 alpha-glucosidase (family GH31 glycosyl hydrolase) [Mucilaginibacter sp. X5P1]